MPKAPEELYGRLFADVQRARVFPDQKTFPDAVPKRPVDEIVASYAAAKRSGQPVDLAAFVGTNFLVPETRSLAVPKARGVVEHVNELWRLLERAPDRPVSGSSLLPLPHPYIVPGGRFREIYYWDSYFTMLGLRESGEEAAIQAMMDNFAYLIRNYGHIPNGNRTYYLSRSQPPFFSLMLDLLAEKGGESVYAKYLPELRAEYAYWSDETAPTKHRVALADGAVLSRYYDQGATPRAEAFALDEDVAKRSGRDPAEVYRAIRSACESGWDFSTRWFSDGQNLTSIDVLDVVPVDLNCLLFHLESTLARACRAAGHGDDAKPFEAAARRRKDAVLSHCWSADERFFCDYRISSGRTTGVLTLAGLYPLFFGLATPDQASAVREQIEKRFLKPGGVVTSLVHSGQQWDGPNGWAPLEWITVVGLERYGHRQTASLIARRWIDLNVSVYNRTGKLMEKYNVENASLEAGGGEYPGQDGFGWTNGVLLALMRRFPQ
ncbi:trehalase [Opitutaceae bacterium EW11]|nr:trehalase [Opitutaceae bacterium EW11]